MMRILVTRPEPDNTELKRFIEQHGHHAYAAPMLAFKELDVVWPDLNDYDTVVTTSKNAVRLFSKNQENREIPLYTVGEQSAELARENGFATVVSGPGSVKGLIDVIQQEDFEKPLLYIRGEHITVDLKTFLYRHHVDELVIYEMLENIELPEDALRALENQDIDVVLFYSLRTAKSFFTAIENLSESDAVKEGLKRTIALCLGESVIEYVSKKHQGFIEKIDNPSQVQLLETLENFKLVTE
ncbi:MAG: uroporphyrinogen-III synthase [Pseudomonadota bacterium]